MSLFNPEPYETAVTEPMSPGRRLTELQRRIIADGRHPATRVPLFIGTGERCGTCVHHQALDWHNKTFHKCTLHRLGLSHSEHSDIRVSWPACARYEADDGMG